MKKRGVKRNDPSSRRGRRTNDTIVSAVIFTLHTFFLFVKQTICNIKSPPTTHSRFQWFNLIIFDFQLVDW